MKASRVCPYCEGYMTPHNPRVKTCGSAVCREAHAKAKGTLVEAECGNCGATFSAYRSAGRKYCSYPCSIADGSAQRAGEAAAMSINRRGHRKDDNHHEIVSALERLGIQCLDMSHVGSGFPDLMVCRRRETHLVEIKNPETAYGRAGLNALQQKWADCWRGGPVYMISNLDECISFANGDFDKVPHFGGDS